MQLVGVCVGLLFIYNFFVYYYLMMKYRFSLFLTTPCSVTLNEQFTAGVLQ